MSELNPSACSNLFFFFHSSEQQNSTRGSLTKKRRFVQLWWKLSAKWQEKTLMFSLKR